MLFPRGSTGKQQTAQHLFRQCLRGRTHSERCTGESFLSPPETLPPWSFLACGCIPPISASILMWPSPLCPLLSRTRILVIGFRVHLDNPQCSQLEILIIYLQRLFFQIRSYSQAPGIWAWTYLFRATSQLTKISNNF